METIPKSIVKLIKSLQLKKFRQLENLFLVEGRKMVSELLDFGSSIRYIAGDPSVLAEMNMPENTDVFIAGKKDMERMSALSTNHDVLAVAEQMDPGTISEAELYLALDNISDPGNLGTILRIADWFGLDQVLVSANTVDVYNPKVVQASMGSIFRVRVHYCDLEETLSQLACPVWLADMSGEDIREQAITEPVALLMGSESHGVSQELQQICTKTVSIVGNGKAESLNVAVSTGIILSHLVK